MARPARRPDRQAHRARLLLAATLAAACASMQDPPGGPPDEAPPVVVAVRPESGSILTEVKGPAVIQFDEVITEVTGQRGSGGLAQYVLLSPTLGAVDVSWHRREIHVRPDEGWRPGRVYHLTLLPGITDLRNNRLAEGRFVMFSTGPALPAGRLSGTALQWEQYTSLKVNNLIEATLLPDTLPYRALTDSTGNFRFEGLPAGEYLAWAVEDRNSNRRRDPGEAFDTVRVRLDTAATVTLWAFQHDTVGPRLRSADVTDSVTIKLTLAAPVNPYYRPDTAHVAVLTLPDSQPAGLAEFLTSEAYDSLKAKARAAAEPDTAARPDTAVAPPVDTARAEPQPGPPPRQQPTPAAAQVDTALMALLRQRPKPANTLYLHLSRPLVPGRYLVLIRGVPNLAGVVGETQGVAVMRAPEAAPAARPEPNRP